MIDFDGCFMIWGSFLLAYFVGMTFRMLGSDDLLGSFFEWQMLIGNIFGALFGFDSWLDFSPNLGASNPLKYSKFPKIVCSPISSPVPLLGRFSSNYGTLLVPKVLTILLFGALGVILERLLGQL